MKNKKFLLIFVLFWITGLFIACESENVLPENDVPEKISTYISTHFSDNSIIQVIKDKDGTELSYDVTLDDGFFLEFNKKMEITDIEGNTKLPDSVIPVKPLNYVSENYAERIIIAWELDDSNQQIKLDNNLELEFTMDGEYFGIDY